MNARADLPLLGLHLEMPIAQYHASPGISNTGLSDFARSPHHFHALHLHPDRPASEETPAQLVGNLAHCAILEPAEFPKRYVVGPSVRRGTKVWDAFEASLQPGQTAIKAEQEEVAMQQAESARALPDVAKLLASGRPEVSAFWHDPSTGVLCRCRPDWCHDLPDGRCLLLDAKTVGSAAPNEFARQVHRMGYARQAAVYSDGYEIASGKKVLGFVFLGVETTWPFAAAAYMLPDEWLALAREEIRELLLRFAQCRTTDTWHGYSDSIQLLDMPAWVAREAMNA